MSSAYDFLKEAEIFWVATCNGENPEVRPFGAVMNYEGHIYIITHNGKDVYRQMKNNMNVQVTANKKESRDWIRIYAKAVESADMNAKQAMFEACPVIVRIFESPENKSVAIFKLTEAKANLYTDTGIMAISVV